MFSIYAALDQRHRLPRLLQDRYPHFTQENQKSERLCGFLQVTEQSHVVSLRTSDSVSSTFFYPFPTLSYIPPLTPHPLMITFYFHRCGQHPRMAGHLALSGADMPPGRPSIVGRLCWRPQQGHFGDSSSGNFPSLGPSVSGGC